MTQTLPAKTVLLRGLKGRCPCCGEGRLLRQYLSANEACAQCHEDFTRLKADDGPAWLTILIVGHISIPLLLSLEKAGHLNGPWILPIVLIATIIASLLLLPVTKGVFMAILWLIKNNHA